MSEKAEINTSKEGKFHIIKMKGKIDADASPMLSNEINSLVSSGNIFIILDLSKVSFMSSAGIGVTVKALNDTRSNKGDFRIASIQAEVKKVYELLGFAAAFRFYRTVPDALSA